MSLNAEQLERTSVELKKNYEISELTPEKIQADLGISKREFNEILNLDHFAVDPTNVWRVRDYMEEQIKAEGKNPHPYTVLLNNRYFPYK